MFEHKKDVNIESLIRSIEKSKTHFVEYDKDICLVLEFEFEDSFWVKSRTYDGKKFALPAFTASIDTCLDFIPKDFEYEISGNTSVKGFHFDIYKGSRLNPEIIVTGKGNTIPLAISSALVHLAKKGIVIKDYNVRFR